MLHIALVCALQVSPAEPSAPILRVDAFGYRPAAQKAVVVRQPVVGFDGPASAPLPALIELREASNGAVVASAPVEVWNGGAVDPVSGDRVGAARFDGFEVPGDYYAVDPATGLASERFSITVDPYGDVRRAAQRMFFYQRCNVAKQQPFAEGPWADGPSHLGEQQDGDCRSVLNPIPATSLDLTGGWFDAGDFNKYVNFADQPVHDLLAAWRTAPWDWSDAVNLPESGNGVPDILDEAAVELRWLLKMQRPDGSLLHKVSVTNFSGASPPSAHTDFRRYAPPTASATVSGAGVFAHGAYVFGRLGDASSQAFAVELEQAAVAAWNWLEAHPASFPSSYDNQGFVSADAEDSADDQLLGRGRAAVWLFALTGATEYRDAADAAVVQSGAVTGYVTSYERGTLEDFLFYADLQGATPSVAAAVRSGFESIVGGWLFLEPFLGAVDPYRAWMPDFAFHWGSSANRANIGSLLALLNRHGLTIDAAGQSLAAAEGYAQSMHGVNPLGHTYLTALHAIGAPASLRETYHAWFADGTAYDNADTSAFGPAPGYVVGGPNQNYVPDGAYAGPPIVPPQNQPPAKSYRDWNADWPENSWELSECAIGYQGAYLRLLSFLGPGGPASLGLDVPRLSAGEPAAATVGSAIAGEPIGLAFALDDGNFELDLGFVALDLGLAVGPQPALQLIGVGAADAAGRVSFPLFADASLIGQGLLLQAFSLAPSVEPRQSAVRPLWID